MKRLATALALVIALAQPALADGRYYGHHRHHGGGGGDPGMALFGGLVGGLIIGGMINSMNQPNYGYAPQPQFRQICRTQFVTQYDGYYDEYIQVPVQQCRWVRAY
jgi:hypothetical protein